MNKPSWTKLYVLGAGGHAKVVADVCVCAGYQVEGFLDRDPERWGHEVLQLPVVGDEDWLIRHNAQHPERIALALGIGDNHAREAAAQRCRDASFALPCFIHPSATIAASATLGAGTVVMAGAAVNPDSTIGEGVILNTGCVVEHDNRIDNYAHLSANASTGGTVSIGARTHLGLNSTVLPNLTVGADVVLGAGGVIIRDTSDRQTLAGVPARSLHQR